MNDLIPDSKTFDLSNYTARDLLNPSEPPYKICFHEQYGRYMVASRDIEIGEIILEESPLVVGPYEEPICLECLSLLPPSPFPCSGCHFPLCSPECSEGISMHIMECQSLQLAGYTYQGTVIEYRVLLFLRILSLQSQDSKTWNLLLNTCSHSQKLSNSVYWSSKIKDYFRLLTSMSHYKNNELFEKLFGIVLVNSFEIIVCNSKTKYSSTTTTTNDDESIILNNHSDNPSNKDCLIEEKRVPITALYALASLLNHDCLSNTSHSFVSSNNSEFNIRLKAGVCIKKGEEITVSYIEPLDHVVKRNFILRTGKFFDCQCTRCLDPSENGSHASSLLCSLCKGPVTWSLGEKERIWTCESSNCDYSLSCATVERLLRSLEEKVEALEGSISIEEHERALRALSKSLHPHHVFNIRLSYKLAKMLGRNPGYEPLLLSIEKLQEKKTLCEKVLFVLNRISRGNVRMKGVMMYELHLPLVLLAQRLDIDKDAELIMTYLNNALQNLKEGLAILSQEPEGSFEFKIVEGSKDSVAQLEEFNRLLFEKLSQRKK